MEGYLDATRPGCSSRGARGAASSTSTTSGGACSPRAVRIPVETVSTRPDAQLAADWSGYASRTLGSTALALPFTLPCSRRHATRRRRARCLGSSTSRTRWSRSWPPTRRECRSTPRFAGVATAHEVPGRMERVIERSDVDPLAIVDYAHTPDALELALSGVRPITPGQAHPDLWLRRRSRPRQAARHGSRSRPASRTSSCSPTRTRAPKTLPRSAPRFARASRQVRPDARGRARG